MHQIPLSQGLFAIVDESDYVHLSAHKWHATKSRGSFYAMRRDYSSSKSRSIMMHAVIMGTPQGSETDHINGNGLDNRKSNLRVCSTSQNQANRNPPRNNTSGFKGVSGRPHGMWMARITANGKRFYLGTFKTAEQAAKTYDAKAREMFGEFAYVNLK